MGSQGWLERYRGGEREQVWHELRQWGDRVREPGVAGEAQAVCDEMARRARHNVELVVGRLREQGYRFHTNDDAQDPVEPLRAPTGGAASLASWLPERFGPVPMVVSSWLRLIADVWLVGTHPDCQPLCCLRLPGGARAARTLWSPTGSQRSAYRRRNSRLFQPLVSAVLSRTACIPNG